MRNRCDKLICIKGEAFSKNYLATVEEKMLTLMYIRVGLNFFFFFPLPTLLKFSSPFPPEKLLPTSFPTLIEERFGS